ncbi:MAG TPA: type 2 lanthipeptide synthetase LanM family protein [Thermoanaerobaculia bacterium]
MADPVSAWRALALAERAHAPRPEGTAKSDELARFRLGQWRDLSPFRSGDALARRLADEGLDESTFERLLAEPAEAVGERLPQPPQWFSELTAAPAGSPPEAEPLPLPPALRDDPGAGFLELIRPWIERARARLREGIGTICRERKPPFTAEEAERLLSEPFAFQLLPLLSRTLVLELNVARLQELLAGDTAEERFASFVDRLRKPEVAAAILDEYPALARLAIEELDAWVVVSLELLGRLAADWPELVATFFGGRNPGPLKALGGGAGDRHRGGRAVRILEFASGARLAYKPRSMAVDAHFQELLAWIETKDRGLSFRRLRVLDRRDYGWMEYAEPKGCACEEEVAIYHRRLGGLLALLYALEATDCHYENLIAAGGHPVVVDLESLFHPRWEVEGPPMPDERLAGEALAESVLRIGLLPFQVGEGVDAVDLSGVASVAGQPTPQPVMQWRGIGTDEMRVVRERVAMEGGSNRPSLDGREIEAAEFTNEMADGFSRVYRLLVRHRAELLAFLDRFADDPVRAVLRPTRVYGLLLSESFHPDVLRDALDRDLLFDRLWVGIDEQPVLARAIPAEHRDLRAGDIPAFQARPSSVDAWTSRGERLPGFFLEPAIVTARRRIERMGEDDLRRQLALLRLSLGTQLLNRDDVGWTGYAETDPGLPLGPDGRRERMIEAARKVGEWFESMALRDGRYATWIGLDYRNQYWSLVPMPEDLYAGLPGVALFLGYLGAMTGRKPHRKPGDDGGKRFTALARAALESLLARHPTVPDGKNGKDGGDDSRLSIGAFTGWGGLLYTVAHLGSLWRDPALFAAGERMAERILPRIDGDEEIDVVGGSAGAIFGLLALHRASGSRRALEVAVRCGEHLLARSHAAGAGLAWLTHLASERPQIGFSHGNAGIGAALAALGAASGEARFLAAGLAAFDWEREAFWPTVRGWLAGEGGQPPPESAVAIAWCYGAPGVAMARMIALPHVRDREVRQALTEEVREAISMTYARGFGENHCLCHGDLGNFDFLLQARLELKNPNLDVLSAWHIQKTLASIERDGWLCGTRGGVESPALMNGFAGIGYGLLRLAERRRVPSVLALQPPVRRRSF